VSSNIESATKRWVSAIAGVISAAGLLLVAAEGAAKAQSPSPALQKIETMVSNMGYAPKTGSSGDWFSISSSNNYIINFTMSEDGSVLYLYSQYGIKPAQQSQIPLLKLLQWNDTHRDYFSISKDETLVVLNNNLPAVSLTPQQLRASIDDIANDSDKASDLFDPSNWH
jgi:hypothetical protein